LEPRKKGGERKLMKMQIAFLALVAKDSLLSSQPLFAAALCVAPPIESDAAAQEALLFSPPRRRGKTLAKG